MEKRLDTLKQENKTLVAKFEDKSVEIKLMKNNVEDLNKEKNLLNVALKTAKQDVKARSKKSEKKISDYEKKIHDLNEFRVRKLNEERQEKMRKKKELKKKQRKLKLSTTAQAMVILY